MDEDSNGWDSASSSSGGNSLDYFATENHGTSFTPPRAERTLSSEIGLSPIMETPEFLGPSLAHLDVDTISPLQSTSY